MWCLDFLFIDIVELRVFFPPLFLVLVLFYFIFLFILGGGGLLGGVGAVVNDSSFSLASIWLLRKWKMRFWIWHSLLEDEGGPRLEDQTQSANGTQGQTSGSGRPLDCSRGLAGSPYRPQGVVRLLGGPIKLGLLEEPRSSMLGYGLEGLDPTPSLEAEFSLRPKEVEDPVKREKMEDP